MFSAKKQTEEESNAQKKSMENSNCSLVEELNNFKEKVKTLEFNIQELKCQINNQANLNHLSTTAYPKSFNWMSSKGEYIYLKISLCV